MNDYFIHPIKTYKAEEWLSVREFGRNLPLISEGEFRDSPMDRNSSFASAFKTFLDEVQTIGFDLEFIEDGDFKGDSAKVLNEFGLRYGDHYICNFKKDASLNEILDAEEKTAYLLIGALNASYLKYQPILNAFKAKEAGLMGDIKTTSSAVARFNDTPQNSGTFDDDPHTTNITQSSGETSSAGATPIQRLDEVRRGWRNIIKEWVDELGALTIEGANL